MGVKVQMASGTDHSHPTGEYVAIDDGHLLVKKESSERSGRIVAAYAPGKWMKAVVEDAKLS